MKKRETFKISNIIYRLLSSVLIINIINLLKNNNNYNITFMQQLNYISLFLPIIICFIIISFITLIIKKKFTDYIITIIFLFISSLIWLNDNNIFFVTIIFLIFLLLYHFKPQELNIDFNKINKKYYILIIISAIFMFGFIATVGILRYKLFNSPNFDLGIPGQNFYYLKKIGIPYSTCERNMLLNHFKVHFSPIFYLILPIYYLFSHVTTLQVMNGLLISSSILPIYLICKHHKLPKLTIIIICLIFTTYAPAICCTYYDFHENIFLIPLLLWLFYFYEKNNDLGVISFATLVLFVKEDAPLYIIIFSIFAIFDKKTKYGIPLIVLGTIYFITVTNYLKIYGDGLMTDRYNNLLYNDRSILGIIKTILINPGYFIKQLITSNGNNIDKIKYILEIFLPLGFIPLYSKEKRNYLLLIPILITIMTTYEYSYNIDFHYSCGIIAFMFYLFIKNIKDIKIKNYLIISLISSLLLFRTYAFPQIYNSIISYTKNKNTITQIEELLKEIPKNASVNAETFILPHLVNRDVIYEVYYHKDLPDVDYVVFDIKYNDYIEHYNNYIKNGYQEYKKLENEILILKK